MQWAQSETQKDPSEHQKILLYCGGGHALALVTQRSSRIFILGDIQKLSGHVPGQLAFGSLA